jgi:ABC-type multidrug transport system fused ATPase/permease subunit
LFGRNISSFSAILNCLASIALVSVGSPYLAAAVPVIFIIVYMIQKFYLATSRQLRLLDLEAKSPLFTHFTETVRGISTVQAFGWQEAYYEDALCLLDASQRPSYLLLTAQRWLNVVMNLVVAGIATVLVAFAVHVNKSLPGAVGVGLVSLLGLNEQLALLVLSWTSLEVSLGAIARLRDFERDTPQERPTRGVNDSVSHWPTQGRIEVHNLQATYGFV